MAQWLRNSFNLGKWPPRCSQRKHIVAVFGESFQRKRLPFACSNDSSARAYYKQLEARRRMETNYEAHNEPMASSGEPSLRSCPRSPAQSSRFDPLFSENLIARQSGGRTRRRIENRSAAKVSIQLICIMPWSFTSSKWRAGERPAERQHGRPFAGRKSSYKLLRAAAALGARNQCQPLVCARHSSRSRFAAEQSLSSGCRCRLYRPTSLPGATLALLVIFPEAPGALVGARPPIADRQSSWRTRAQWGRRS